MPRPGEPGHDTWLNDGWKQRSGVNIWGWYMTVDEARSISIHARSPDRPRTTGAAIAPAATSSANSMVAVDATTGKYKWHFQTVHHDLWDSDMPSPPTLVDIRQNGRTIPALASVGKTGYMFILESRDGQADLRRRGAAGAEGRRARRVVFADAAVSREAAAADARRVQQRPTTWCARRRHVAPSTRRRVRSSGTRAAASINAGPFTPFTFHEEGAPPKSTIQFPGGTGGVNWGGPAADPRRASSTSTRTTRRSSAGSRRMQAGPELRPRHRRLEAALRPRQRQRRRSVLHVQRADARRDRPRRRQPSVPASAVGHAWSPSTRTPATSRGRCRSA